MTIAEDFVAWAWTLSPEDVPAAVKERAALHVLDGLGVALAGRRLQASPFAEAGARMFGTADEASVIGSKTRASAAAAAFANGMLMHGLDYDDTHTSGLVHATAVTAPPALAVGEQLHRSGRDVLRAIIAGYELVGRLGTAAPHGFHARGFHATSVCGAVSAALVAAHLLRLPEAKAVQALGIAGSFASGSMEFLSTGAATKQVHPGWASLAGIVAARLAAEGVTGPTTVFEGQRGLFALFTDLDPDLAGLSRDLGRVWQTDKIAMKPYPACHLVHATLDAAATIRDQVDLAEIETITVSIPQESIAIVAAPADVKIRPRTSYEAKFSVQWSLAAFLRDGAVDLNTFEVAQLARPDILAISERVICEPATVQGPAAEAPGDVRIALRNGKYIKGTSPRAKPDLKSQVVTKFRANAAVSPLLVDDLIATVIDIEQERDLKRLFGLLTRAGEEASLRRPLERAV